MDYRIEKDTFGEIKVPAKQLWGAQTERSLEHFKISTEKMPLDLIKALAIVKKASATVNKELGLLDSVKADAIIEATETIISRLLDSGGSFNARALISSSPQVIIFIKIVIPFFFK